MKTEKQIVGNRGEQIAADYLLREGFQILERNWRYGRGELDIIAMDGKVMVFVEVKTLKDLTQGQPDRAIVKKKRAMLWGTAGAYMEKVGHDWEIRFDFISIHLKTDDSFKITHHKDAFWPMTLSH